MLSTAARYVAQLMLPGGVGLRSTALSSSTISGIHVAMSTATAGPIPRPRARVTTRWVYMCMHMCMCMYSAAV